MRCYVYGVSASFMSVNIVLNLGYVIWSTCHLSPLVPAAVFLRIILYLHHKDGPYIFIVKMIPVSSYRIVPISSLQNGPCISITGWSLYLHLTSNFSLQSSFQVEKNTLSTFIYLTRYSSMQAFSKLHFLIRFKIIL